MSKLYFFRHAQASYGAANYDKLSPKGEEQSAILGKHLVGKGFKFDRIFVGPLVRQQHTFRIVKDVFQQNGITLPEPIILEGLKEHSGTQATKIALPKLANKYPVIKKLYADIDANPALKKRNSILAFRFFMSQWVVGKIEIEGIEPWATFRSEVKKALNTILEATQSKENIGIFSSGGTISAITAEALKVTDEERVGEMNFAIRNTAFSSFFYSDKKFNLLSFNELPHLEEEMITFI